MKTNNKWKLWSHNLHHDNWELDSYNNILEINNLYDLKIMTEYVDKEILLNNMIFLMKDNILPIWEDENNRNGCSASFKITNIFIWNELSIELITLNIFKDLSKINEINGISITLKKNFYIIKIWFKNNISDFSNIINNVCSVLESKNCRIKKHIN